MSEQNKALVLSTLEALNSGDQGMIEAAFDKAYASDLVYSGMGEEFSSVEGLKEMVGGYLTAFPDMQLTIDDQVAEGDRVVTRFTARGTHDGEFQGVPATGRSVSMQVISIVRIVDGVIVEEWEQGDQMGMMGQLGLLPEG